MYLFLREERKAVINLARISVHLHHHSKVAPQWSQPPHIYKGLCLKPPAQNMGPCVLCPHGASYPPRVPTVLPLSSTGKAQEPMFPWPAAGVPILLKTLITQKVPQSWIWCNKNLWVTLPTSRSPLWISASSTNLKILMRNINIMKKISAQKLRARKCRRATNWNQWSPGRD